MKRAFLGTLLIVLVLAVSCAQEKTPTPGANPAGTADKKAKGADDPIPGEKPAPAPAAAEEAAPAPSETVPALAEKALAPAEEAAPAAKGEEKKYNLKEAIAKAQKYIPDSPVVLAVVDPKALLEMYTSLFGSDMFILPEEQQKVLEEKLFAYHLQKLGFALKDFNRMVVFVGPTGDVGVIAEADIEIAPEKVSGEVVEGHTLLNLIPEPSAKLFLIEGYGVGLYVAQAVPLDIYLKLVNERGDKDRMADFAPFVDRIASNPAAWFAMAMDFAHPIVAIAWPEDLPVKRPDKALVQFVNRGLVLEVEGSTESLDSMEAMVKLGKSQVEVALAEVKAQMDTLDVAAGTAVIIGDAYFEPVFQKLAPKRSGNSMRMEMTLDVWGGAPVIGILAAVAIPAFLKYIKRAKVSEAIENLEKIRRGAEDYFCTPKVSETGEMLPRQFPPMQLVVPSGGSCCAAFGGPDTDGNDACDADSSRFDTPTWKALKFQIVDKHFFTYEFKSNGKTGNDAEFEAIAYGDLDCDGVRSTFVQQGVGRVEGDDCSVYFGQGLYIENETE
jgi:type IV pilus assembly protein PilA